MKNIGIIYVIAAASGTGKTSLVKELVESFDHIVTSISYTTRGKRSGERSGENYFFVSTEEFEHMIAKQEFLEYAKVFGDYYGTSRNWVEEHINKGIDVILEIDWQGGQQIKKLLPNSISIFILPPSLQELRHRLETRRQDDATIINKRLAAASEEISHCKDFDYIVVNDKFDEALADLRSIIRSQRLYKDIQLEKHCKLLKELMKQNEE
jgi:guanylate kinase